MDFGLVIARIIHVLAGVLWVGMMFFLAVFLAPSMREVGPDAAKVMGAMMRRKVIVVLPNLAVLSIFSGLYLYWRVSAGFKAAYMSSGPGMTYGVGAVAAILAFVAGMTVTRPAMVKSMRLSQRMPSADASERETLAASIARYQSRAASGEKVIITLLLIAATAMAVGRYTG